MAVRKFLAMAYRSVIRNTRRSALTALAVALGLVVVMLMAGLIEGMVANSIADNIRVRTGHLQLQSTSYEAEKASLLSKDLLRDGEELAVELEALNGVQSAAPVLWTGGLLSTPRESVGVEIVGIDPQDVFHAPIREGIVAGDYLAGDDRGQLLVGKVLADQMDISVGQRISLAASDANGVGQEGIFTVVGLVDTGFPGIDQNRVLLPLAQAQSFSGVGDRVSSVIMMLDDQDDPFALATQLDGSETKIVTWQELNRILLESVQAGMVFYYVIYAIVFLAVAVIIANTLLMSVFERTREIGILASLGMSGNQIMTMVLFEAVILAIFGVIAGWILGLGAVTYMAVVGISIPLETATLVEGMAFGTTMKGGYAPEQFVILSILLFVIVAIVSLYPAWYAARLEPVEAIHTF